MALTDLIKELKAYCLQPNPTESGLKSRFLLPILSELGWNTFSPIEVEEEHPIEIGDNRTRVDYALACSSGRIDCFIEAKSPRENLSSHEHQLLNYANHDSVPIALLTNGQEWRLYLPLANEWPRRRFATLNLSSQDADRVADELKKYLSKSKVCNGEAKKQAEASIAQDSIPTALQRTLSTLLSGPDEELVSLLLRKIGQDHEVSPTPDQVRGFLKAVVTPIPPQPPGPIPPPLPPDRKPSHPPVKEAMTGKILARSPNEFAKKHSPQLKYTGMHTALDVLTACRDMHNQTLPYHYKIVRYAKNDGIYIQRENGPGYRTSKADMDKLIENG